MYKDIEKMITEKIKTIRYDRTFRAKVTERISDNNYKVLCKNKEYPVRSDFMLNVGDLVWVCAPGNDWNSLFVQTYSGAKTMQNDVKLLNSNLANYILKTDLRYAGNTQFIRMDLVNTGDVNTSIARIDFCYNNNDFFRVEFTKQGTVFARFANGQWS